MVILSTDKSLTTITKITAATLKNIGNIDNKGSSINVVEIVINIRIFF